MNVRAKVAVVYHGGVDVAGFRLAMMFAAGAWDAGAEVRVRRLERLVAPAAPPDPTWAELLREDAEVPEASAADLVWADAVLFGTSAGGGAARRQLGRLIDALLPSWSGVAVPLGDAVGVAVPWGDDADQPADRPAKVTDEAGDFDLAAASDAVLCVMETIAALQQRRSPLANVA